MTDITKRQRLASLAGQHFQGERDLYEVFGYPRYLTVEDYAAVYTRQDIAARIVDCFPDATWREEPEIMGDEGFRTKFSSVVDRLSLWRAFHRLDRLTGIGHYGVLVLGLDGGEPMHKPAQGGDYRLLYVQPHSERTAQITQWEDDPTSPRFGMPRMYRITTGVNWTGAGAGQKTFDVHWSRCVHVAERAMEDVSIGTPRLERVFNRLMDLDKLLGGSAEMYWQNVAMMMAFMADADVELEPEDKEDMQGQFEEMQNGLRRFLTLRGVKGENLAPGLQGADPGTHIDKQLEFVAGAEGIPKRILVGSERGELSSAQDENNWQARIAERREQFAGPSIIEAFIGACQRLGVLPQGFQGLEWPEGDSLGEEVQAKIAQSKADALQKYTNAAGAELVVSAEEFRSWLGLEGGAQVPEESSLDEEGGETVASFQRWQARRG